MSESASPAFVTHQDVLLDGSILTVELPTTSAPPRLLWAYRAWYTHPRVGPTLIASAPAGTSLGAPLADATVVAEASAADGRTMFALSDLDNREHPTTTFVYQCAHFELYTTQAGSNIPMDDFVSYLAPLDISDSAAGIAIRPRPLSGASIQMDLGVASVGDLAIIEPHFNPRARQHLPANRGKVVRGGEMWSVRGEEVILANDSVVSYVSPGDNASQDSFPAFVETLRLARSL